MSKNKTLELTLDRARELYPTAPPEFKTMLEDNFGKKQLQGNILQRVTGFETACVEIGKTPHEVLAGEQDFYRVAEKRIETVAEALREGKPESECFYYPWFDRSGGGFSFGGYGDDDGYAGVGARLRVDTPDKARHLGEIMLDDYRTYITGKLN